MSVFHATILTGVEFSGSNGEGPRLLGLVKRLEDTLGTAALAGAYVDTGLRSGVTRDDPMMAGTRQMQLSGVGRGRHRAPSTQQGDDHGTLRAQ
jgi:hypothetical protein